MAASGWSAVPMNKLEISSSRSNKQIQGLAEFVPGLFVLDAVTGRGDGALLLLVSWLLNKQMEPGGYRGEIANNSFAGMKFIHNLTVRC